jgi:hypothetical protein
MPDYIEIPIAVDADTLAQEAYDFLQAVMPGWAPASSNLETWLIEAAARLASVIGTLASTVPSSIFRWFGANLVGVPPIDATPATTTTTWTVKNTAGYTIPGGTQVAIPGAGDTLIAFETVGDVIIAPGASATASGEIPIVAITPGADGSGLGGAGTTVELLETLEFVTAITQTAATTGGVDAEDDATYLDRLRTELQLLTPRPILPAEFAALARNTAGVYRALAVDGYNPADDTTGNPRMVCLFLIDIGGSEVGSTIETAVVASLQAQRELNFVVNVAAPTYTSIDVTYSIHVQENFDPAVVEANVSQALDDMLNPANWGLPAGGDQPDWLPDATVRYTDTARTILNIPGVDHIASLEIGVHGGALGASDVALTGQAPLTEVGTITGSTV